jgi:hypothetical protein
MKLYKYNDMIYTSLPDPFFNTTPMSEVLFVQMGGVIEENSRYEEEFEQACVMFRALCSQIGQFISNPDFHGGFGEMATFAQSEAYQQNPVMGNTLSIQWAALNEECKYFGSRIGLNQPDWWYRCWELVGLDLHDSPSDEEEQGSESGEGENEIEELNEPEEDESEEEFNEEENPEEVTEG